MRRLGLPLAAALVLLANAVVLARVAHNRTGEPEAVVTLTERELSLAVPWRSREDSGMALRFDVTRYAPWTNDSGEADHDPVMDTAKLASLGFDVRVPEEPAEAHRVASAALSRRAFAVLESDGPRWAAWKGRLEARLAALDGEVARGKLTTEGAGHLRETAAHQLQFGSRLFIVDVGLDAGALRRRYPDRHAHFILPALVKPYLIRSDWNGPCRPPGCRLGGSVSLLTPEVNVPHSLQGALPVEPLTAGTTRRYLVDLTVGRGLEPWITAVRPAPATE